MMKRYLTGAVALVVGAMPIASALGAISYSTTGSTYSENFNSLPTDPPVNASLQGTGTGKYTNGWQDDTTTVAGDHISIPGVYLYYPTTTATEGGTNQHQRFREGNGQNTGSFWGFSTTNPLDTDK